jgi:hypothetical protein
MPSHAVVCTENRICIDEVTPLAQGYSQPVYIPFD